MQVKIMEVVCGEREPYMQAVNASSEGEKRMRAARVNGECKR